MGLETGTYISDLVATNPTASDPKNQGDDHLRLLKSTVKATFPNVAGAVTPTHTELNYVDGVTSAIQTQLDAKLTVTPGTGVTTFLTTPSSANLRAALTDETGTGAAVFADTPTLVTPVLGTPGSGTLTNCTGLPVSTGISGFGTGVATFLATPSSSNLKAAVTDETGSGALVFGTSPALATPTLTDPIITGTILEDVYTISDGAAFEIDPGNGSIQLLTLGASRTPKATNFAAGESVTLMVADGTAYSITWTDATFGGSGVVWVGATAPTLPTSGYGVIELWKVGTQVYGASVGDVA